MVVTGLEEGEAHEQTENRGSGCWQAPSDKIQACARELLVKYLTCSDCIEDLKGTGDNHALHCLLLFNKWAGKCPTCPEPT